MNQKKCKALRAHVAAGFDKAPLIMKYTYNMYPVKYGDRSNYPIPRTFKYPEESFQRVYRDLKKGKSSPYREDL